ncbi:MAG: hypothetical protein IKZ21_07935 [Clostridia bacterium]|nr:hypothetical protein [Clostridia bacterium]
MDLIHNQTQIPREKWRYGLQSSAAAGCGWIAGYNALLLLGQPRKPEEVLRWFARRRPLLNGLMGTTFGSMLAFFKAAGLSVTTCFRPQRFDALARDRAVCVLFYVWRQGWKIGAHYVTFHPSPEGFVGYNTFRNSIGPDRYGESLLPFLKDRHDILPALIALERR